MICASIATHWLVGPPQLGEAVKVKLFLRFNNISNNMRYSLFLVLLIGAAKLDGAPVPQSKSLPTEIQVLLQIYTVDHIDLIHRAERRIRQARTEMERELYNRSLEDHERKFYTMPVKILENAMKDKRYQGPADQDAIGKALEKFRQRLADAKRKNLFKPEETSEKGTASPDESLSQATMISIQEFQCSSSG